MKKTKVFLITGFLGAGKTSAMKSLIDYTKDKNNLNIGIIVNEFGKINVDARTLYEDGLEITEINNGSIFCKCLEGTFVDHVVKFGAMGLDFLFVESSGLSDPSSMESIMNHANKLSGGIFEYSGIFCVADAKYFSKLQKTLVTVERQVASANLILLNKTDLADEKTIASVIDSLSKINPYARIIPTTFGKVPDDIFEGKTKTITPKDIETYNTPGNRPDILLLKTENTISRDFIKKLLNEFEEEILRLKGFVFFEDGLYHIEAVGTEYSEEKADSENKFSQLVMIPYPGISIKERVSEYISPLTEWDFEVI